MIIIDILGFFLGITGAILVGQKKYLGFLFFMLHSVCYGVIAIIDSRYGLLFTCVVFFFIDLNYFFKWKTSGSTSIK